MKYILLQGLFLLVVTFTIKAQQPPQRIPPGIEERWRKTNEVLQKEVQPTTEQSKTIAVLFKSFFAAADKLRKDNPPPNPKVKEGIDKLVNDRDEKVKKILTVAQYGKYKAAIKKLQPPKPGEPVKVKKPVTQ